MKKIVETLEFEFKGKGGTFVKIYSLNKAQKGHYKNDVIRLRIKSKTVDCDYYLTPKEALVISSGLQIAVVLCKKQSKGLLK